MAVHAEFRDFVLEQLGRHAADVAARPMFGGVSISSAGATFALIDDDQVYLKGDDRCRDRYEAAGWPPFRPFGPEGGAMAYFALPGELLDAYDELAPWVEIALGAAQRVRRKKGRRS
jgi:TfoX/Sxy family transcriptional regulator of competence genes